MFTAVCVVLGEFCELLLFRESPCPCHIWDHFSFREAYPKLSSKDKQNHCCTTWHCAGVCSMKGAPLVRGRADAAQESTGLGYNLALVSCTHGLLPLTRLQLLIFLQVQIRDQPIHWHAICAANSDTTQWTVSDTHNPLFQQRPRVRQAQAGRL